MLRKTFYQRGQLHCKPAVSALTPLRVSKRLLVRQYAAAAVSVVGSQPEFSNGPSTQQTKQKNLWQKWCDWWDVKSPESVAGSEADANLPKKGFLTLFSKLAHLVAPDRSMLAAACVFMVSTTCAWDMNRSASSKLQGLSQSSN